MVIKAKQNVPVLRFSEFDEEWKIKRLGQVCSTFKSGNSITSKHISEIGPYPVFGGNGLRGYTDSFTHEGFYVLIGRQGALCGNINRARGKSFISEHAIAVSANKESDTEWLAQRLDHFKLNRLSESSAQPGLAVNKLVKLKLLVPSLPEQQKIAQFLTTIDTRIQQLSRKVELLEQYKKGVMQRIFSQELRFRDEGGKGFPEWEEKELGEIADPNIKWSFTGGPFGSDLKTDDYTESGVRIIQLQNIGDGVFLNNYKIYTSEGKADQLISCNIFPNEIIISKMGDPVARACIIPNNEPRYLMASDGIRLVPNKSLYSIYFIYLSINHHSFRKKALSLSTGSTRKRIGLVDLRKIRIKVPNLPEQQRIAEFVGSIDQKIAQTGKQLEYIQTFKKGLLQQLFV
jgi:type I restriction enzyme S subunit